MTTPRACRLILANLDAELSWEHTRLGGHATLPRGVRRALAATGACMAVYGRRGDRLWLPDELDPARLGPLLAETGVALISGEIPGDADEVLAWGLTEEAVRAGAHGDAALAAELNDRRTSLALEAPLDPSLTVPNPRAVRDEDHFRELIDGWPHPAPWILKSPLSASGRARIRRTGQPDAGASARVRRLFDRFGVMVLEPWLDRLADYGILGFATSGGANRVVGHQLDNDGHGVFRSARLDADVPEAFLDRGREVGDELSRRGYRGPYSVDGFSYRTPRGTANRLVCEINARLSFGHIARAVVERFDDELSDGPHALEIVRGPEPPAGATLLVRPCRADPTSVVLRRWA